MAATDARPKPPAAAPPQPMQKAVYKRTVDYTAPYLNLSQARLQGWSASHWDAVAGAMPLPMYADGFKLLPDTCYLSQPAANIPTKLAWQTTNRAKSAVNTVLWLPDGRRCMTGSNNGDLVLWDGRNFGLETSMQGHQSSVRSIQCTHSEWFLLSSDDSGTIRMWNGKRENFLDPLAAIPAHKEPCRSITLSPTDRKLASASDDSTIKIHDIAINALETTMLGHGGDVRWVEWHPRQGLIASGSKDALCKLWDPRGGGAAVCTLHGHKNGLMQVRWNPQNDHWLLTAARDQTLKVFDVRQPGRDLCTYQGHQRDVTSACWHPHQEELFVSGGYDGAMLFWLVSKPEAQATIPNAHDREIWSLAWHPAGHMLTTGGGDLMTKWWCRQRPGDLFKERLDDTDTHIQQSSMGTTGAGGQALPQPPPGAPPGLAAPPGLSSGALGGTLSRIPGLGDIVNKLAHVEPDANAGAKKEEESSKSAPAPAAPTPPIREPTPPLRPVPGPGPAPAAAGPSGFRDGNKRPRDQYEGDRGPYDGPGPGGWGPQGDGPPWDGPGRGPPSPGGWGRGGPPGGRGWGDWRDGPGPGPGGRGGWGRGPPMGGRGPGDWPGWRDGPPGGGPPPGPGGRGWGGRGGRGRG